MTETLFIRRFDALGTPAAYRVWNEGQVLKSIDRHSLKNTDYNHLGQLGENAQIIVFENIDPPAGVEDYCKVEAFTNDAEEGIQHCN